MTAAHPFELQGAYGRRGSARRAAMRAALLGAGIWSCGGGSGTGTPGSAGAGSGGAESNASSSSSSGANGSPNANGSSSGSAGSPGTGSSSGGSAGSSTGGVGQTAEGGTSGGSSGGSGAGGSSSGGNDAGGANDGSSSDGKAVTGGAVSFSSDRVIVTGVRNTATPAATSVLNLHNGAPMAVNVTALALGGADQALFQVTGPAMPAAIMPGQDLPVTVQMTTTGTGLPTAPTNKDLGSNLLSASLTATLSTGSTAQASVYGLLLIQSNWEPTLGQIITTLGHKLNVGQAQNNWNPNTSMNATTLPGIEAGTDEVAAPHFVKSGSGSVTMSVVARFSPVGVLPYGWYPQGASSTRNVVGTMSMITDPQTSDKARTVFPPLATGSSTTFDPGASPFGIWVYSDQATQKYATGNAVNGDYDYTEDSLNSPANVHRIKTYPLKDASGAAIAQSYLVAVEEAANGDYQDYVFVLGNVNAAP